MGLPGQNLETLTDEDVQALQYAASVLSSGFPLVAFLQLARVYGQALAQIADAEVRLFHIYVHEPLMREGVPGMEMAEEMEHLARDLLPLTSPLMDYVHQRFLQHYIEQDVVGHMEVEMDEDIDLGRLRVAIAFCDLAGYTRFTEEEGEEEALSFVERFVEAVTATLPDDARVIKTIGDEVMIVGQDVQALTDWAVGFQQLFRERPEPRIGIHYGVTLYRDGDYYGREVNLASRVVARARGGEVVVTDAVVERVAESEHLVFEGVGQVKLKGFDEPRQLCRASDAARAEPRWIARSPRPPRADWSGRASRCWCCCPAAPTPSACSTWRCGWARPCRALHVNYGLREDAEHDEAHCRALCSSLEVELAVERAWLPSSGNLQAHARDARYRLAERHASGRLRRRPHRLRPGRDGALPPRRLARPPRAARHGGPPRAARAAAARRHARGDARVLPLARPRPGARTRRTRTRVSRARAYAGSSCRRCATLSPAAERTIAETARLLRDEAEVLDGAVADALDGLGGGPAVELAALAALPPAVVRLVLRSLAEDAFGGRPARCRGPRSTPCCGLGRAGRLRVPRPRRRAARGGGVRHAALPARRATRPRPHRWSWACRASCGSAAWEVEAAVGSAGEVQRLRRRARRARSRCAAGRTATACARWASAAPSRSRTCSPTARCRARCAARCRWSRPAARSSWVAGVALDERFAAGAEDREAIGLSARRACSLAARDGPGHRRDPRPAGRAGPPRQGARRADLRRVRGPRACCWSGC